MNETESHIAQAIQSAKEGNPNEMQDSLGAALSNKITDKYTNDMDYYLKQIEDSYIAITNNVSNVLSS